MNTTYRAPMNFLVDHRVTTFRFDLLGPMRDDNGTINKESLLGTLNGVHGGEANWQATSAIKGRGSITLSTLDTPIDWMTARIRPVAIIKELHGGQQIEQPCGVFIPSSPVEEWSSSGRVWKVELLDKNLILDEDIMTDAGGNPVTFSVGPGTNTVETVISIIESAGESAPVIEPSDRVLTQAMTWDMGTTKLKIINDILSASDFASLRCDGRGQYRTWRYVPPQDRPETYFDLSPFVVGPTSVRSAEWTLDRDIYDVPNRMVAISTGTEEQEALTAVVEDANPDSPFSYQARGRWVTVVDTGIDVADYDALLAYARRRMTMLRSTAARITVAHLYLPAIEVDSVVRFIDPQAGIDGKFAVRETKVSFDPLELASSVLEEVAI